MTTDNGIVSLQKSLCGKHYKTYELMNVDVLVVLPYVSFVFSNLNAEIHGKQNKPFPGQGAYCDRSD